MGRPATLSVKITGDSKGAQRAMTQVEKKTTVMGRAIKTALGTAAVYFGARKIGEFVTGTMKAADDVEAAMGRIDAVFGKSGEQLKKLADGAAQTAGVSKSEYGDMAAKVGMSLKSMGFSAEGAAGEVDKLITLGADVGGIAGKDTATGVEALRKALQGSYRPLKDLGVNLTNVEVDSKIAAMGLDTSTEEAKNNAEAMARLALITEKTSDVQGFFAEDLNTAGNAQQRAAAQLENMKAKLGEQVLPLYTKFMDILATVIIPSLIVFAEKLGAIAGWIVRNIDVIAPWAAAIGIAVVAINAATIATSLKTTAMKAAAVATKVWAAAQRILNAVMKANPIGIVITIVMALVAAIVTAYKRSETFRNIVQAVWRTVQRGITTAVNAVISIFRRVQSVTSSVWSAIRGAVMGPVNAITGAISKLIGWVRDLIGWFGKFKLPSWFSKVAGWFGSGFSMAAPANLAVALAGAPAGPGPRAAPLRAARLGTQDIANLAAPSVRVYIGDRELTDLVRIEVGRSNTALARRVTSRPGEAR